MGKKFFIFLLAFVLLAAPLVAQVSFVSVTDEDAHSKKEDFWHTFEYFIITPNGSASKCQATRIGRNWFATAAHCVKKQCAAGCTLRIDLLEQSVSALVTAEHTPKKPIVFAHPSYDENVLVSYDFALLKIDFSRWPIRYYLRPQGNEKRNIEVTKGYFDAFLKARPYARREYEQALRPTLPPILVFGGLTRRIDRTLSVISIFNGKRNILKDPYPTYYVKDLGFAYTQNFGVRQGMSGSGVMTNTGELAGIISAYVGVGDSDKLNYFVFAVFNEELTEFMEGIMEGDYYKLERKDAYPNFVSATGTDHTEIITIMRNLRQKARQQKKQTPAKKSSDSKNPA